MIFDEILKWLISLLLIFTSLITDGGSAIRRAEELARPTTSTSDGVSWNLAHENTWYGPGFYGNTTACGIKYNETIKGVAHRTLPCGTLIRFKWKGIEVTAPVIDRGPYGKGRTFDLSRGLCLYLKHCFTGPIYWRIVK